MTYSKTKCSDEKLIEAAHHEPTMAKAAVRCGLHFTTFKRRALELGVYMPNQGSAGVKKGHYSTRIPTEEILEGKHPQYQTYKLRNRLIEESILGYECSACGINDYMGIPISLELDHINGDRRDHRLENLRLLCPNCHSQTPTYRSKKRNGENKMAEFNITDPEIIKMLKGLTEEERQDVADQIQESLDSGEIKKTGEQKEINEVFGQITSCAIKAAKQVMEEHSKAFEKLAESEE